MNSSDLHNAIYNNALGILNPKRISVSYVETVNTDGTTKIVTRAKRVLPDSIDAELTIIDAIAKAVAEEVVKHIQDKAEVKGGNVTTATIPYTNTLPAFGGGVPGSVTVFPTTLQVASGTINIAEAGIK